MSLFNLKNEYDVPKLMLWMKFGKILKDLKVCTKYQI